ncbi:MAG: MarR family transcriptional regulator [Deltaproteobacteria bacterium]|nr:MarR family transcriptional regulator [Deltaproteobacteria bacterium]
MEECNNPLPRLIYLTSLQLQGHADNALRPHGLTLEQFHPLKIILLEGGTVKQRSLCGLAAKTPANMTRILDRLTAKGFIKREPDPNDRRAYIIHLTPTGKKRVNEVAELLASYLNKIMNNISGKDERCCRQVLEQISNNLGLISPKSV